MDQQGQLNWDHLRIFLAVMRATSLRQAAERLGISHPTLRRRLDALEEQLGVKLFVRHTDGLHATPEASSLLSHAEHVEESIHAFGRCLDSTNPTLEGKIHVTAADILVSELMAPALAEFAAKWPAIKLYIETSYELVDLGTRKADVAFRIVGHGNTLDGALAGRKAATMYSAVYGEGEQWLSWWEEEEHRVWLQRYPAPLPDYPTHCVMNNAYALRAACLAGMGLCVMPCHMAPQGLKRHTEPIPSADIWVLVHPDLRRNPRLRLFRDEMVASLKDLQPVLAGEVPGTPGFQIQPHSQAGIMYGNNK